MEYFRRKILENLVENPIASSMLPVEFLQNQLFVYIVNIFSFGGYIFVFNICMGV